MKRSTLETYALAVCFLSLFCLVISSVIASFDAAKIISPSFTMDRDEFNKYQSNDSWATVADPWYLRMTTNGTVPTEKQLTGRRMQQYQAALADESHAGQVGLFRRLITLLLTAIVFLAHWKIAKRARQQAGA